MLRQLTSGYEAKLLGTTATASIVIGGCNLEQRRTLHWESLLLRPVFGQPAILRLVRQLRAQGLADVKLYGNVSSPDLKELAKNCGFEIAPGAEPLPAGPGGALRRGRGRAADGDLSLVLPGNLVVCPPVQRLIEEHRRCGADVTVAVAVAGQAAGGNGTAADGLSSGSPVAYIVGPAALAAMPAGGYVDFKEALLAALTRRGLRVHMAAVPDALPSFRDYQGYLGVMGRYLAEHDDWLEQPGGRADVASRVWISSRAQVADSARLYGPVAVLDGARIEAGAVICGPTVIEREACVGSAAVVSGSVLWPAATLGTNCQVHNSVIDEDTVVAAGEDYAGQWVTGRPGRWGRWGRKLTTCYSSQRVTKGWAVSKETLASHSLETQDSKKQATRSRRIMTAGMLLPAAALVWSYWPTLEELAQVWLRSDEYSSGLLVPLLAAYLAWTRRSDLKQMPVRLSWCGLAGLLLAQAFRYFGFFFMYGSAVRLSLVLTIASLVLFLFGWRVFRKLLPITLFLFLMLPLPHHMESSITQPLQSWATSSAVFSLELLGYDVTRDGNLITVAGHSVTVAEACNGLRMVTGFMLVSALVVLLSKRRWWEQGTLLLSSLPIALLCNTIRLTFTAIAFTYLEGESLQQLFHDYGGYAMMPLALLLLVGELWVLRRLVVPAQGEPTDDRKDLLFTRADRYTQST